MAVALRRGCAPSEIEFADLGEPLPRGTWFERLPKPEQQPAHEYNTLRQKKHYAKKRAEGERAAHSRTMPRNKIQSREDQAHSGQ